MTYFGQNSTKLLYVGGSKSSETSRISPSIYDRITQNLYRMRNYHFLICQCCQNDAVHSGVHDVIVWWRHATVTWSKTRPKLSFSSEVQLSTFMFNVAVIFSRLLWTWRSIIGTNSYLCNFSCSTFTYSWRIASLWKYEKNSALNPHISYQKLIWWRIYGGDRLNNHWLNSGHLFYAACTCIVD